MEQKQTLWSDEGTGGIEVFGGFGWDKLVEGSVIGGVILRGRCDSSNIS